MAKISLSIEADGLTDLADTLSGLAYIAAYRSEGGHSAPVSEELDRDEVTQAEEAAPAAPKPRGRKPKTETTAAAATPAPGVQAPSDPLGLGAGPTATPDAAPADDAAMALLLGASAEPAATVSKDDVTAALKAAMGAGVDMVTLQQVFVTHGAGAKSISQVEPQHYAAVLAAFQALA